MNVQRAEAPEAPAELERRTPVKLPPRPMPREIDQESYLAWHGASRRRLQHSAAALSAAARRGTRSFARAHRAHAELLLLRESLRRQYRDDVVNGAVRPPDPCQQLAWRAEGDPRLAATHTARRLLGRHLRRRIDAAARAVQALEALRCWRGVWRPGGVRRLADAWLAARRTRRRLHQLMLMLPDQFCVFAGTGNSGRLVLLASCCAAGWRLTCNGAQHGAPCESVFDERDDALAALMDSVRLASLVALALPAPAR